jgi:hypothetical protein
VPSRRVAPGAYQALREALPVIFWYKRPFRTFLHSALREQPELLAGINFDDIKRNVADTLVDRLMQREDRYQEVTLQLMLEIATMQRFPDLEQLEDSKVRLSSATGAVAELRRWTDKYSGVIEERQRDAEKWKATREQAVAVRKFTDDIAKLRQEFLELHGDADVQGRGRSFQGFLASLFALFDLEPRLEYVLEHEQIDGSLSFDTDDYILEARWRNAPTGRDQADVFAAKVRRKGKNALGLFVSVNGFTSDTLDTYSEATPFMAVDGVDLMAVLDQRVRLDDLLRRKKRHANETGHCFFPAWRIAAD